MTKIQEEIMEKVENGQVRFEGKYGRSLKVLEKQGLVKIERKVRQNYVQDFREYVIHGQYRTGVIYKKIKYVIYNVEAV